MKIKNKVKFAIIVIVTILLAINATWYAYVQIKYAPYKENLSSAGSIGHYFGKQGGCLVGVMYPVYLDFKNPGCISLTHKNDKCGIALYIWLSTPLGDKENEYGITIYDNTEDNGAKGLTQSHQMYVNNVGYPTEETDENLEAYNKYKDDIEFIFNVYETLK